MKTKEESSHRQNSGPLLTIITRCYKRPKDLTRCLESIKRQTDSDIEHIMIHDKGSHGMHWANKQIFEHSWKVHGEYVYILDDDDFLLSDNFVSSLKELLIQSKEKPDIIICKGWITNELYPTKWNEFPERGGIGSPNFIVKREIFIGHSSAWDTPRAGDYQFITSILNQNPTIYWWDKIFFYASMSSGFTAIEKKQMKISR